MLIIQSSDKHKTLHQTSNWIEETHTCTTFEADPISGGIWPVNWLSFKWLQIDHLQDQYAKSKLERNTEPLSAQMVKSGCFYIYRSWNEPIKKLQER